MTALLAVEFEPEADASHALRSLKRSGLVITSLDVSPNDAMASVEVIDHEVLDAAVEAICKCSCVRSGVAFPSEA